MKVKKFGEKKKIFDPFRRKWITLTPEEWVRQHMTAYLVQEKQVPASLIANEISIRIHQLHRRCDTVIFNTQGKPVLIAEYKAPQVPINQQVFDQIAHYNMKLQVRFLLVSNGLHHYCCQLSPHFSSYSYLKDIPTFNQIISSHQG